MIPFNPEPIHLTGDLTTRSIAPPTFLTALPATDPLNQSVASLRIVLPTLLKDALIVCLIFSANLSKIPTKGLKKFSLIIPTKPLLSVPSSPNNHLWNLSPVAAYPTTDPTAKFIIGLPNGPANNPKIVPAEIPGILCLIIS